MICGIDEAGRGPIIGPMVMAGIVINEKDSKKLEDLDVKDSKLLNKKTREYLFPLIIKIVHAHKIVIVPPEEIDQALIHQTMNLNRLEAVKSALIINTLNPTKAILDCPSRNIEEYKNYVKKLLNIDVKLIVEHKADLNHIQCAAASILAKVTRDNEINNLKQKIGINFGSGYPSDPVTKDFIKKHWKEYPEILRKKWSTYTDLIKKAEQKSLGDY